MENYIKNFSDNMYSCAMLLNIDTKDRNRLINLMENDYNMQILILAIETFPENEIVYLAMINNKSKEISDMLISRLSSIKLSKKYIDMLLMAKSNFIRAFAVKFANFKQLIKIAMYEENSLVANNINESLKKFTITESKASKLLKAKSYIIKIFAISFARIEDIISSAYSETNIFLEICFLEYFKKNGITTTQANILINAKSDYIRKFAVEYANLNLVIIRSIVETDDEVIEKIISRLILQDIKNDELLNASSPKIREFGINTANYDALAKAAHTETDNKVLDKMMQKLIQNDPFPSHFANLLINIPIDEWREYLILKVDKDILIQHALIEEKELVIKQIISRLEKETLTSDEAEILIKGSHSDIIKSFALNYANIETLIFAAITKQKSKIYNDIFNILYLHTLTNIQADTLLESPSYNIRLIACEYATIPSMLKLLENEEDLMVISKISSYLSKENMSIDEANKLLNKSKCQYVKSFLLDFVSKNCLIAFSITDFNPILLEKVLKLLLKIEINDDDAKKLIFATYFKIAKIGIDHLGNEKVANFLKDIYQ